MLKVGGEGKEEGEKKEGNSSRQLSARWLEECRIVSQRVTAVEVHASIFSVACYIQYLPGVACLRDSLGVVSQPRRSTEFASTLSSTLPALTPRGLRLAETNRVTPAAS